jgi:allantoinase
LAFDARERVIRSERVLLPEGESAASIHVREGKIVGVAAHGERVAGVAEIDAGALVVMPGLVDTHVHMNDPGRADWEGAEHATRAAACAGVTTIVDMPLNSIPATTDPGALDAKRRAIEGRCHVDVAFWGGIVPGNAAAIEPLAAAGVRGFKCFLSPSGVDEFAPVTERDLREALPHVARTNLPLLVHAEWPARLEEPDGDPRAYATWLASRPASAETAAIERLIALAGEFEVHVHVVHLASEDPLPALRAARRRGVRITVETCPHYLVFAAEDIPDGATVFKCAPPIREAAHREALWRALAEGDLDLVATDHSPAPAALKCAGSGSFVAAWGGIASLQVGFPVVATAAARRGVTFERVVRWMSAAPAALAGLSRVKGSIRPGADADVVIWDPDLEGTIDSASLLHRHPLCPYVGMATRGGVRTTILRGETIYRDGDFTPPRGSLIGAAA